ncbi:MAG: hypothetical protein Ct9H90mP20_1720 [Candidatus Neomarinimicrobiota bacterium]|nr:MAG: hypothetical protein Ct9H90mP20_1720 [Candidatus Neomarinimicrobiota bacterium]
MDLFRLIKGLDRSGYHITLSTRIFMIPIHLIISQEIKKGFYEKYGEEAKKKMGDAPWYIEILCNRIIYLMKNNRFEEALLIWVN